MPFRLFNSDPSPRFCFHATTNPTGDNLMPVGSIWVNLTGVFIFVCTEIISPNQANWTPVT